MPSEPQATQVNLLRYQKTEIPPNKSKRKQFKNNKHRPQNMEYKSETNQQQAQYKQKFNPKQILQSEDRCHKCGDSKQVEGFQCSAHKYHCRNCQKSGHFSSLCYKKQEFYKKGPRSSKAYQLASGRLSIQDNSICSHSSDNSSSDESFCLQIKVQAEQAHAKYPTPQHLFTNLEFKVKPNKNKTKFLQVRIDTCADVNIMPVSIYKYLFKDLDCTKIAPSDLQLGTYTNKKVKILGSCNLYVYVIHQDTRCIAEVTFLWLTMKQYLDLIHNKSCTRLDQVR